MRPRTVGRIVAMAVALVWLVCGGAAAGATRSSAEWNVAMVGGPVEDRGTTVAVVDTGVDPEHPALAGRVLPAIDLVGGSDGDPHGHGTHVAGTAAGRAVDCGPGPSALGVASGAAVLPVRVLDGDGVGTVEVVAEGIRAAADRGAEVINLSLGPELNLGGSGPEFREALEYAWQRGSIPVLAAGNGDLLGTLLGSGYGDVPAVVVTAVTREQRKPGYATSVGSARWGIAAPGGSGSGRMGEDVLSAWPDRQCALLAGTSMAAPHVSGALAVLRARGLGPRDAVERLLDTAAPLAPASVFGAGLLDLTAAAEGLAAADAAGSPNETPETTGPAATGATTTPSVAAAPPEPDQEPAATGPAPSRPPTTVPAVVPARPDAASLPGPDATLHIEDRDEGAGAGAPLVVGAGMACAAAWAGALWLGASRLRGQP